MRLLIALLLQLLATPFGLAAQEVDTPIDDEFKREKPRDNLGNGYNHRLRFKLGLGQARFKPAILTEAGPAWQLNSFIAQAVDSNTSPVFQLSEPGTLGGLSTYAEGEYTYIDRWTFGLRYYRLEEEFDRDDPATVDFYHPPGATKRWSYFEGVRLVKYKEQQRTMDVRYLHPVWLRGLRVGAYLAREWYEEADDISFGSFVTSDRRGGDMTAKPLRSYLLPDFMKRYINKLILLLVLNVWNNLTLYS